MSIIPHVTIPLTRGAETIIDETDADLAALKWTYATAGYAFRNKPRRVQAEGPAVLWLHRVIMERMTGTPLPKGSEVDHANRNKLDNRRANLRMSDRSLNSANREMQRNNSTGYRGVYQTRNKKRWRAAIGFYGEYIHLGVHDTPEEAARAYDAAALRMRPNFAMLNFPSEPTTE